MKQKPLVMTKATMVAATNRAKDSVDYYLELGRALQLDTDAEQRHKASECKACYYCRSRMGGSAITERPCMCCGTAMVFCSTSTDVLCLACARAHELCRRCGGDLDLRVRRRNWPKPEVAPG